MAGEIDFAEALRQRVRLLAGLKQADLDAVRDNILLTPGARTLVRTLKRLGYEFAVVSGGFTQLIGALWTTSVSTTWRRTSSQVEGVSSPASWRTIVDRAGKATALAPLRRRQGAPGAHLAVGDGANDLDMLAVAGLGIAFNAKPLVREAADAAVSVPYLDAIFFLLGFPRTRQVERRTGATTMGES